MVRLPFSKICILALLILLLEATLLVVDSAKAASITFDEFPQGSRITDEYRDLGVVFSGEPIPPIIGMVPEIFPGEPSPALYTYKSYSTSIAFVDPATGDPVDVSEFWISNYIYGSGHVIFSFYDITENLISQYIEDWSTGGVMTVPPKFHKLIISPPNSPSANVWTDYMTFTLSPPPPPITDPGPSTECEAKAGQPINLTTGDVWISKNDYSVPGLAGGLSLTRTWNSRWNHSSPPFETGMFGRGWTSDFEERLQVFNSNHIIYWRGSGNTWVFEQPVGCTSCSYSLTSPANDKATLKYDGTSTQYTLSFKDGTKKVFSKSGNLQSITDRNGNQTTITYDGSGRIIKVSAPGGQWISFTYGNSQYENLATSAQDSVGTVVTFNYADSNLTKVVYTDVLVQRELEFFSV